MTGSRAEPIGTALGSTIPEGSDIPNDRLHIDHVIYGVVDIDAAAERLRREHGLGSVSGGRLQGGVTNRIVPLRPPVFLELLGVDDPTQPDGAWLSSRLAGRDQVIWWCLGVDDIQEAAARRGLPFNTGEMTMVDGPPRVFHTAGMPNFPLPFFISFDMDDDARMQLRQTRYRDAEHECEPGGFTFVEVGDTPELLAAWIGEHDLPVRHLPNTPSGIHGVGIETSRGEVVLR